MLGHQRTFIIVLFVKWEEQTELYKVLQNFAKHGCKKRAFLQTPVSSAKMLYKFLTFK